jgi:putative FmdB family regulatory protein
MPLYEYRCESCGHRFEVIQKFSDALIAVCPKCGAGPVVKLLSSPAIQFKGSGFYITDYARKGEKGEQGKESKGGKGGEGGERAEQSKGEDTGKGNEKDSGKTPASTSTASSESTSTTAAPKADPKSST